MKYKLEKPVHGTISTEKFQCVIEWRNGKFIADEPEPLGGKDSGPDPYTLFLSSLASSMLITLRMYIDQNGWTVDRIAVSVNMYQETRDGSRGTVIDSDILFLSPVSDEQKMQLLEIAKNCPVSKMIEDHPKLRVFAFRDGDTKTIRYANEEITVLWKPEFCQHSTRCWTQLPEVFKPALKKWVDPDGAPAEKIEQQIAKCPSGALVFSYNNPDG